MVIMHKAWGAKYPYASSPA